MTSSKGPSVDPAPTTPGSGAADGPDFAVDPVRAVTHALTVDRVWTVPNALSMLRLLGVPLFLWLLLGPEADGWAIVASVPSPCASSSSGNAYSRMNVAALPR